MLYKHHIVADTFTTSMNRKVQWRGRAFWGAAKYLNVIQKNRDLTEMRKMWIVQNYTIIQMEVNF